MVEYSRYESPMSPHSFLSVVRKRRKLIISLFALIVICIVAAAFLLPPVYRASAKAMVKYQREIERDHLLDLYTADGKVDYNRLASELVVIKMRSVLEPVVEALSLDAPQDGDVMEATRRHEKAIDKLAGHLDVEREKDTNVLVISYEDRDPQLAASVVDAVVTQYIEQRPGLDRDERAYIYFDEQIKKVEAQIDEIARAGMKFKSEQKVLSPDKQTQILFASIADFDKELTRVRSQRIAREASLKILREQVSNGEAITIPTTESSNSYSRWSYINDLKSTLLQLELKKEALLKKYTEKHPEVQIVLGEIEQTKTKMRAEGEEVLRSEETSIKALREAENALAQRMNQVVNSISRLSRQEYELGQITIGIDDLRKVHSMLIRQREEAKIAAGKKEYLVQVRLLEPAIAPQSPVKPNKALFAGLAILLGLIFSFGFAFFLEYFDHSVNTPEDAQHCLGLPILASIPDLRK